MSLLQSQDFHSDHAFASEQREWGHRAWQFVGFRRDLPNHHDYFVVRSGKSSVVIQNFKGELRAFSNVCPHRSSRIRLSQAGNGPLQCPYHGWVFDATGLPIGIPQASIRQAPCFEAERFRLSPWRLESCGEFLFLTRDPGTPPLKTFLAGFYDKLLEISDCLGPRVDRNQFTLEANWKIVVENTLDDQHVDFVHVDTFVKRKPVLRESHIDSPHSAGFYDLSGRGSGPLDRIFRERPMRVDGYFHYMIFPTMTVASTMGISFAFQRILPLGPHLTEFTSDVFLSKGLPETGALDLSHFTESVVRFNRQVFEEDRVICEGVHQGLQDTEFTGFVSADQARVLAFHEVCRSYLAAAESKTGN